MPWEKVFRSRTPKDAIEYVSKLLVYDPAIRPRPLASLLDSYFDELRDPKTRLPNGMPLPDLFNFTPGKKYCLFIIFDRGKKRKPCISRAAYPFLVRKETVTRCF